MNCPYCNGTNVDAEFVDIGVGFQQVTPYQCDDCWARQMNPYDDQANALATDEERKYGWFRGPSCWKCLDAPSGFWVAEGCCKGHHEPCDHPEDARNYK